MTESETTKVYLQLHEAELRSRDSLGSSLSQITSTITILGAGAFYLLTNFPDGLAEGALRTALTVALALGVVALVVAVGFSIAGLWSRAYSHAPSLGGMHAWRTENRAYHEADPGEKPTLDDRFWDGLASELAEAADKNREQNRKRSGYSHRAKIATTVSLVLLGISSAIQLSSGSTRGQSSQSNIYILNGGRMSDTDSKPDALKPESQQSEQKATQAPVKTPFPKHQDMREGTVKAESDKRPLITERKE
ncbi:hypothetical protein [Gemmatimonas sp.]|uniref:hypothetical protein n=1 Tax=Gemmatimonas sp. TaxID=1962908 RepID=UPI00286E91C5|nr:hypothetical protein [Gemmatimonas sp.]